MFKKDINNFYVGELYLSEHFGSLFSHGKMTEEERMEKNKIQKLKESNAVDFQKYDIDKFIDWNSRREYEGFLTIFYKKDDNHYICLHNGNEYTIHQNEFYENLVPLREFLPKKSYNIPNQITVRQSLILFNELFKNVSMNKIKYEQDNYSIHDFYVGNLNLCTSFDFDNSKERSRYMNLPQHTRLSKIKDVYTGIGFGMYDNGGMYNYSVFRCLFLKNQNKSLYNVHDFQNYNKGITQKEHFENEAGESYYDWMIPFKEYLEKNGKTVDEEISIPKALTLYKK